MFGLCQCHLNYNSVYFTLNFNQYILTVVCMSNLISKLDTLTLQYRWYSHTSSSSKFKWWVQWWSLVIPRSVMLDCISSPVYEVKRLNQDLGWPLGLVGSSPSLPPDLRALETYCPRSCIFYKLRQDSHIWCVHCSLYRIRTVGILAVLRVQVCTSEPSGLCGLLTALQQPWVSIYS
jgi:hypothetical protein